MITRIGKFEVKAEIGHGAFGRVYRAYDPAMRRDVAIKVLDSGDDPKIKESFRNEADTTGRLRHENILTVYDFVEDEGRLCLVMELLEGENLESIIFHKRPLSLLDKVLIMNKVGRGLQYAHENRVVHRDIKPANIMLLPDGGVKIMDFGIARLAKDTEMTRSTGGNALGTVLYMSPEQFREGTTVDKLADIFSFGAVYYELISGLHPFDANDTAARIYRITSEDPVPIRQFEKECPEELERVVLRALSKEREARYQNVEDLLFDTEPITRELGQQRATVLIEEANEAYAREDLDRALANIRDALELDRLNQAARSLRKKIDDESYKRGIGKIVAELEAQGRLEIKNRQFREAAETFERALRLEQNDQAVRAVLQALLGEAQAGQERARKASRFLSEGRAASQQGDFEAALRAAAAALEGDPGNEKAEQFRRTVEEQIEEAKQAARNRAVETRLKEAREEMEAGRLKESSRILENASAEFPEDARLGIALLDVRERIAAARQAALVAAAITDVRELMARRNYSGARARLESALEEFPHDPQLKKMPGRLSAAQTEFERSEQVRIALADAKNLANGSKHEEALKVLIEIEDRTGHDDTVLALRRQIAADRDRAEDAALRKVLGEVRAYLAVGVPERALPKLQSISGRFGKHPDFQKALLSTQAQMAKTEREVIDRVLEAVARFEERAEWRAAGAHLESALNVYPSDARLARAQQGLLAKIAAAAERNKRSS